MVKILNSDESRFHTTKRTAYKLAAGAVVATHCAAGSDADAQVVYSGLQDIPIGQGSSQDLNLDGDDYNDILLKNYVFGAGNYQGATVNFYPGKVVGFTEAYNYATALGEGFLVDSAATAGGPFAVSLAYGTNPYSQFDSVTDAYIGLEFPIFAISHFGWIRVDINNVAGTFVIKDWAYESQPGVGITVGDKGTSLFLADFDEDGDVDGADFLDWQRGFGTEYNATNLADWQSEYGMGSLSAINLVPEPGTLGLLAAGACGLSFWRKRRADKTDRAHEDQA